MSFLNWVLPFIEILNFYTLQDQWSWLASWLEIEIQLKAYRVENKMRKLFSFRTSAPSSGNCDTVLPPTTNGNVYWEPTFKTGVENRVSDKAKSHCQSPKDPVLIGGKRCPESQDSAGLGLRRSLSFSSPATGNDLGGRDFNCLSDFIRSPTNNILPLHATDYPIRYILWNC